MKKFLIPFLPLFSLSCLSSCSGGDAKKLGEYFADYYDQKFEVDTFRHIEPDSRPISDQEIPGLKKVYTACFSYYSGDDNLTIVQNSGSSYIAFEVSASALSVDYVDIPVYVSVKVENVYSGNFTKVFRFKPYTYYFANILADSQNVSFHLIDNKNNVSTLSNTFVTSGHFYYCYVLTADFNHKTFTSHLQHYERETGARYNIVERDIVYYFGNDNPRIEGLSNGTYYVDGSEYAAGDSFDADAYFYCKKANNVFKLYNDTRYITAIS